jgi:hypothetical protein
MKNWTLIFVSIFFLTIHFCYSQNKEKKIVNTKEIQSSIAKINSIFSEYYFSKGESKFERFAIKEDSLIIEVKIKYSIREIGPEVKTKIEKTIVCLKDVSILNRGRVATGAGLEIICNNKNSCIKTLDAFTNEPSFTQFIVYPIDKEDVINKMVTEFSRIKFLLDI